MKRLSPMDAQFIDAEDEDRQASFAIASIAIFEGPAPSYDEFLEAIRGRLPLVPMYRRKLRTVPFRLGPPVWVDDPDFDLRYHVRHTALPAPGGPEQLRKLMARVMAQRLDRDYPLWEYWLVEGMQKGRWALISKVHHAMVDGVSGTDLYRVIFDLTPEPPPPVTDTTEIPAEPSGLALASRAALDLLTLPARALASAAQQPSELVHRASEAAQAAVMLVGGSGRPSARRCAGRSAGSAGTPGPAPPSATSRKSSSRLAALSTTWSWPRSPRASAAFCSAGTRSPSRTWCRHSCPSRCGHQARRTSTTTGCR